MNRPRIEAGRGRGRIKPIVVFDFGRGGWMDGPRIETGRGIFWVRIIPEVVFFF